MRNTDDVRLDVSEGVDETHEVGDSLGLCVRDREHVPDGLFEGDALVTCVAVVEDDADSTPVAVRDREPLVDVDTVTVTQDKGESVVAGVPFALADGDQDSVTVVVRDPHDVAVEVDSGDDDGGTDALLKALTSAESDEDGVATVLVVVDAVGEGVTAALTVVDTVPLGVTDELDDAVTVNDAVNEGVERALCVVFVETVAVVDLGCVPVGDKDKVGKRVKLAVPDVVKDAVLVAVKDKLFVVGGDGEVEGDDATQFKSVARPAAPAVPMAARGRVALPLRVTGNVTFT